MVKFEVQCQMRYARKDGKPGKGLGWHILKTNIVTYDDSILVVLEAMEKNKIEYPNNKFDYCIIRTTEECMRYYDADYSSDIPIYIR